MHALEWAWPGSHVQLFGGVVKAFVNNHVLSTVVKSFVLVVSCQCIDGRSLTQDTEQQYHHRY